MQKLGWKRFYGENLKNSNLFFGHVTNVSEANQKNEFTKEDILDLKEYVKGNDNGLFEFNYNEAQNAGFSTELLDGQVSYFDYLNTKIENGELTANSDLTIEEISKNSPEQNILAACAGRNSAISYHWWGYSRYFDSCNANKLAAYFGVVPAIPPGLTSAYFWLLVSRIDANYSEVLVYKRI